MVLATGCASVPMGSEAEDTVAKQFVPKEKGAVVYIYRNELLGTALSINVHLNGYVVGQIATKTYLRIAVPAGKYTVESETMCEQMIGERPPCDRFSTTLDAHPGQLLFVWQEMKAGLTSPKPKPVLHLVDEETGKKGVLECKLARSGGVSPPRDATETSWIEAIDWSPDSRFIAALTGGKVRVVDSATNRTVAELPTPGANLPGGDKYAALAFSPDGGRLATVAGDQLVLWDTQNWQPLKRVETPGSLASIVFEPSGSKIIGVGPWSDLTIWNTVTGEVTAIPDSRAHVITISADFEYVATGDELGQIHILSLPRLAWVANAKQDSPVSAIAFSPDAKSLVASSRGIVLRHWKFLGDRLEEENTPLDARPEIIERARQATAGGEALVRIIAAIGAARQFQLVGAPGPATSALYGKNQSGQFPLRWGSGPCPMRLSSDGTRLTVAVCLPEAAGYEVEVRDVASNRRMNIYKTAGPAHAISPDGTRFAIGEGDQLMIRDVTTDTSRNLTHP